VESSTAVAVFPWRQLGTLLVDEGLLTPTELELALDEQRRTGRLLGQIVVDRGFLSAFSLARVLSAQHGVDLREPEEPQPAPHLAAVPDTWRPLGRLLVEKGLVTESDLEEALSDQDGNRRLGELLVERGAISGGDLARALGEQHGLDPESFVVELETSLKPQQADEPVYRIYEVAFRQGFQHRSLLSESANFLEAADDAMEYVQKHRPSALEIERVDGEQQETVWTYSESRAEAANAARKDLVDTFGFDPTRWGKDR
jgi:hypothetical protein